MNSRMVRVMVWTLGGMVKSMSGSVENREKAKGKSGKRKGNSSDEVGRIDGAGGSLTPDGTAIESLIWEISVICGLNHCFLPRCLMAQLCNVWYARACCHSSMEV